MLIKESELRVIVNEVLIKEGFLDWITGNNKEENNPDWLDDDKIHDNQKQKWANGILEKVKGSKSDRKKAYKALIKAPLSLVDTLKSSPIGRGLTLIPIIDKRYHEWYNQSYKTHDSANNAKMRDQQWRHRSSSSIPQDWIIIDSDYLEFRVHYKSNKPIINIIAVMQKHRSSHLEMSDIRAGTLAYEAIAKWINDTYPEMYRGY